MQQSPGVQQVKMAYACMVVQLNIHTAPQRPVLPRRLSIGPAQNALARDHYETWNKVQLVIQVNLQRGQNVFLRCELLLYFIPPCGGQIARKSANFSCFSGH
jgi:hypothetical protein